MKDYRVKITHEDSVEYGNWVDTVVMGDTPYAVVVTDDGKIIGAVFNLIDILPDSENFLK